MESKSGTTELKDLFIVLGSHGGPASARHPKPSCMQVQFPHLKLRSHSSSMARCVNWELRWYVSKGVSGLDSGQNYSTSIHKTDKDLQ